MKLRIRLLASAFALLLTASAFSQSDSDKSVAYPQGYRKWVHVKTVVVGPQNPGFAASGGIHHIYANGKAMEGYGTGTFPEGSVLVFDLLDTQEAAGVTAEGARKRVDVMVKDSRRFANSGGWGFERFLGDSQTNRPLTEEVRGQCFTCHQQRKSHDLVFSEWPKTIR